MIKSDTLGRLLFILLHKSHSLGCRLFYLQALYRNKYFCVEKQHQKQFDFHCFPGGQVPEMVYDEPLEYYAICGTDFENRMEYVSLIWWVLFSIVIIKCFWTERFGTIHPWKWWHFYNCVFLVFQWLIPYRIYCLSVLFVIYYTALCSGSTAPFLVKVCSFCLRSWCCGFVRKTQLICIST